MNDSTDAKELESYKAQLSGINGQLDQLDSQRAKANEQYDMQRTKLVKSGLQIQGIVAYIEARLKKEATPTGSKEPASTPSTATPKEEGNSELKGNQAEPAKVE